MTWIEKTDLTRSLHKKYAGEACRLRKASEQGDAEAQFHLGMMYMKGKGVQLDDAKAVRLLRKAAEQGHPQAQFYLAQVWFYLGMTLGGNIHQNDAEAISWLRKAAEQGYAEAQNELGLMYEMGKGVQQDDAKAMFWYGKAAEQEHARAQFNLGMMYMEGKGVQLDDAKAVRLLRKAAEQGYAEAQRTLGWRYHLSYMRYKLGEGEGVPRDRAKAMFWYGKAAEQGDEEAQDNLNMMRERGRGVPQDDTETERLRLMLTEEITPSQFERLTQRLLIESGFVRVQVTGRSGDEGIDGKGIAPTHGGLLSFRVYFQCKRYKGSVSAGTIRDFRGAMQGRTDKGLFITTGAFTPSAEEEATRDGAPPIDLVAGDKLMEMLKEKGLGFKDDGTIDHNWFKNL